MKKKLGDIFFMTLKINRVRTEDLPYDPIFHDSSCSIAKIPKLPNASPIVNLTSASQRYLRNDSQNCGITILVLWLRVGAELEREGEREHLEQLDILGRHSVTILQGRSR